jgi:hypothetical protein
LINYTEHDDEGDTSMHEAHEVEAPPASSQERTEEEDDPADYDYEGEYETQAYNMLKGHGFEHTPLYDPPSFRELGMDTELNTVFTAVGWSAIDPLWEEGSRRLTIQFLYYARQSDDGITF